MVPTEHRPYVHLPSETPTDALAKPCATARVSQRLQRGSPWAAVARLANGAQARAVRPATVPDGARPGLSVPEDREQVADLRAILAGKKRAACHTTLSGR